MMKTNVQTIEVNENKYHELTKLDKYSYGMATYEDGFKLSYAIISNDDYKNLIKKGGKN